mmetsp:Transcript_3777/g.9901  ORF Transcript_3777/g.9901 Transcript_3777/m.9901 type:complete len:532 (-) Transcript_3777:29-1624(-)
MMKASPVLIVSISIGNTLAILVATCFKAATTFTNAKKSSELTSTALKVHKVYTAFPPHDTDLYDVMEVHPNATLGQITKSYRNLSRRYHPDKQGRRRQQQQKMGQNSGGEDNSKQRLQRLQTAYEILSDDSKRLPYHRYGLVDPNLAATLLLGPKMSPGNYYQVLQQQQHSHLRSFAGSSYDNAAPLFDKLDRELLHLMGYDDSVFEVLAMLAEAESRGDLIDPSSTLEEHRVRTVAALLLESIRPLVEGRIDTRLYAHMLSHDCDRWKRLPLGAQIIRSVGRAYRHEGREFLQSFNNNKKKIYRKQQKMEQSSTHKQIVLQLQTDLSIGIRRRWRSTKDILEAVAVSSRLAIAERSFNNQERKRKQQQIRKQEKIKQTYRKIGYDKIEYEYDATNSFLPQMDDFILDMDEDYESHKYLEEEQKELEKNKARKSMIRTLQIEALWKVCKIDLDRVVRRACRMILSGEYFFYPQHRASSGQSNGSVGVSNGWVASSGRTIDLESAEVTAAEAILMTGEIMVQQSKEGTSWKH